MRRRVSASRSVLVAISGIDGSGKGHVTAKIVDALQSARARVAGINVDGWLNLPSKRFSTANPAEHFYRHAVRFDEMFGQLVLPLRDRRSVCVEADFTEEAAATYRKHTYTFDDIDVILLEGIFLLKQAFQERYDLSFWIECSFETALARALVRGQEGLPPEQTVRAFRTVYFPAQEIHIRRDDPKGSATAIVRNDLRFGPSE